jgi:predicted Zn-dependent protease
MTRPRVRACVAFAVFVFAGLVPIGASPTRNPASSMAAPSPALLDILETELTRNVEALKKQPVPPYFVAYTVYDTRTSQIEASFGAIVADLDNHSRMFGVDVRTGDYSLDNTHEIRGEPAPRAALGRTMIPLTDSAPGVDVAAWQATDRAYHQSVERLARVKTNLAAKVKEEDPSPDFSREDPQVFIGKPASLQVDKAAWQQRLRRVSAVFADDPLILHGDVALSVEANTRYMVSTEGSRLLTGDTACRLSIEAQTKADDGMDLPVYATYYARSLDGLPSEAKLLEDARAMVATLRKLRAAPVVDPYTGPAILSGRAAGVFFHEIFGHRVEGSRQKTADDAQTFSKRVGKEVLPSFLSVIADPTISRLGNTELAGTYQYDDEGVRAQRVSVVDHGVLREFLLDRSPLPNFPKSNGHGRAQAGLRPVARQSNLIVESTAGVPFPQLVERLKGEARKAGKPFGLLFDQVEGGFTYTGRYTPNAFDVTPIIVYRVYTDGRPMELVRGVDIIGTPLAAFNKIVATDNRTETFNGICGAESGSVPVSASSPALLVSEVEVQKKAKSDEATPILPAPPEKAAGPDDSPVLSALGDELARSMSGLRMKNEPAPYYVGYSVADTAESGYRATLGALVEQHSSHMRVVRADVRVGGYAFDSSRFFASGIGGAMASIGLLPIDDNMAALRRQTWLTTDAAYKGAVQVFSRKKAVFENRNDPDPVPDFSKATPVEYVEPVRPATPPPPEWKDVVEQVSKMLGVPEAVASDVSLDFSDGDRYFLNSEGFRIAVPARIASFRAGLTVLAADGMPVSDTIMLAAQPEDLPARAELLAKTRSLLDDVMTTRAAKVGDDYSGPVLVENDAAASLVSQTLVPLFLARRPPDSDRDGRGGGMAGSSTPYLTRIGNRVLPESFTVQDTPSVTRLLGQPAGGAYVVDDEGVKAQDVTLVKDGRLLALLTSRTPQRNLPASNGHSRGGAPQAGVFQVESADGVPAAELRTKYLALLKAQGRPFGYIVRRIGAPGRDGLAIASAVKVTPDGREEAVRGLMLDSPTHTTFRDIVAASRERTLLTHFASGGAGTSPTIMVSVATPSLIFEELDIQRNKEPLQKKPLVPSPLQVR